MPFGRREAKIEDLIIRHFDAVEATLGQFLKAFDLYLKQDPSCVACGREVHDAESEADDLRREILAHLFEGAFVPIFREDYVVLTDLVDGVANKAEAVIDEIILGRPEFPDDLTDALDEMARASVSSFFPLRKAATALLENRGDVLKHTTEVSEIEGRVDKMEWDILSSLFERDLELAQKLILRDTIRLIGAIADRAENAADRLMLMVVKRRF